MDTAERNWAGNLQYSAARVAEPASIAELQELVAAQPRLHALGSRHSFSDVADTPGVLVSSARLQRPIVMDAEHSTVTVGGGVRYGELVPVLEEAGLALHNLGSLPHISIAGACATGTHGSGDTNGNLPSAVRAIEFVAAEGQLVRVDRALNPDTFDGSVISLGALGIVTALTLAVQPSFLVRQDVYVDLPFDAVVENLDEVFASAYSVSAFTNWRQDRFDMVWRKSKVGGTAGERGGPPEAEWFGGTLATTAQHPIHGEDATSATEQLGVVGPWNQRLPHFRLEFTPSSGQEIQTEYLIPRAEAAAALRAVRPLAAMMAPLLMVCELRTVAADSLWLSPSYQQDSLALHFTWVLDSDAVRQLLPSLEAVLEPFGARPHWGKVFTTSPEQVRRMYPRRQDFAELVHQYDPTGKFSNAFLQTYVL